MASDTPTAEAPTVAATSGSSSTVHWAIIAALGLGLGLLAASALPRRFVASAPGPIRDRAQLVAGVTGLTLAVGSFVALLAAA